MAAILAGAPRTGRVLGTAGRMHPSSAARAWLASAYRAQGMVSRHCRITDSRPASRSAARERGGGGGVLYSLSVGRGQRCWSGERLFPVADLVGYQSQGVHVGRRGGRPTLQLLRRHIGKRSRQLAPRGRGYLMALRVTLRPQGASQPEICYDGSPGAWGVHRFRRRPCGTNGLGRLVEMELPSPAHQHHVARLEITMHHAHLMGGRPKPSAICRIRGRASAQLIFPARCSRLASVSPSSISMVRNETSGALRPLGCAPDRRCGRRSGG